MKQEESTKKRLISNDFPLLSDEDAKFFIRKQTAEKVIDIETE